MSEVRGIGAPRYRHDGHVRGFLLVHVPLRRPQARQGVHERGARKEMAAGAAIHRRCGARDPAPSLHALHGQGAPRYGGAVVRRAGAALPLSGHDRVQGPQDVEVARERRDPRRVCREVRRRHAAPIHDVHGSLGGRRRLGRLRYRGRASLPAQSLGDGPVRGSAGGPRRSRYRPGGSPNDREGHRRPADLFVQYRGRRDDGAVERAAARDRSEPRRGRGDAASAARALRPVHD